MAQRVLSQCHLASVMESHQCSFCGEQCLTWCYPEVGYDVELTVRRWADNDCTTEEMMTRLRDELHKVSRSLIDVVKPYLEGDEKPKFKYKPEKMEWVDNQRDKRG